MRTALSLLALLSLIAGSSASAQTALDSAAIAKSIGRPGQSMEGGVYRVGFPRTDLHVTIGPVTLRAGFALGSYAAFIPEPEGTLVVGDLVLLENEIQPVMSALTSSGFEITAVHNHLRGETPHVMYMHFAAVGDAVTLATNLRGALAMSHTPIAATPVTPPSPLPFQSEIETGVGRKGRVSGGVLSIGVPRAEAVSLRGMNVPPAAGVATAINVQEAGSGNVATTGDFVLVAGEVDAVQRALLTHGFEVTAFHHHMVDDSPHLYYMHFWKVGTPAEVAAGLRDALSHVSVKP